MTDTSCEAPNRDVDPAAGRLRERAEGRSEPRGLNWVIGRLRGCTASADLRKLRRRGVIVPITFLGVAEIVRVTIFREVVGNLASLAFFYGILTIGAFVFSYAVFGTIGRLHEQLLGQGRRLAALNRIALASAERSDLKSLLNLALAEAIDMVDADAGLICVVDLDRNEHTAVAAQGFSDEVTRNFHRLSLADDPIASEIVATGRPVAVECLSEHPHFADVARREGVQSSISIPLKLRGEVAGVLALATRAQRTFNDTEREFLLNVGSHLALAVKHAAAFDRALRRTREMEAIVTVGSAATSSLRLPEVLDRALDSILDVTTADAGEIWLVDGGALDLACQRGPLPEGFHETRRLAIGEGLPGIVARTRTPVVVHDLDRDPRFVRSGVSGAGFHTYYALPLVHRDTLQGVLGVAARAPEALRDREELRLLDGVAEFVSVAIDNARLYERVQDEAVIEERERIAHEMHDGLAQVLAYVNAQSIAIHKLVASGLAERAIHELGQMQDAVQALYSDVREAILGLRTSPRHEGGLIASITLYLESFEKMCDVRAELRVAPRADDLRLDLNQEIQLVRIVQESLSNVRRHAAARGVVVHLESDGRGVRIRVEDDGCGFDPSGVASRGWPRFGLKTMQERAGAIGGTFRVLSRPGHGTTTIVELPVDHALDASSARVTSPDGAAVALESV